MRSVLALVNQDVSKAETSRVLEISIPTIYSIIEEDRLSASSTTSLKSTSPALLAATETRELKETENETLGEVRAVPHERNVSPAVK